MTASTQSLDPIWWADPWWEDELYQKEYRVSLAHIRTSIEHLRLLFDKEWVQKALDAGPPNAIIPILYGGKGLWPFQNLMWLSRIASGVIRIPGVHRPLQDLSGQKSWATLLELEVASWFAEKDWQVEFLKPSVECKMPDIGLHKNGISTVIECKRFGSEQWESWAEQLSMAVIRSINQSVGPDAPSFDVLFEPRLSDLVWDDTSHRSAVIEELTERIVAAVGQATCSTPPRSVNIPGIAVVKLRPDVSGSGLHGVGGIEVSPQGKMRRIIRNGVLEAARQLQNLGPGAVVIKSDFAPPAELVDASLRALNRTDKSLLSSVAVVVITASSGSPPVVWRNPVQLQNPSSEILATTFAGILFP